MNTITSIIRLDREFAQVQTALQQQLSATRPLPIVINGLSGGATDAFCAETVRALRAETGRTCLLLVPDEKEAHRLTVALGNAALACRSYPAREFVFYNIASSHDTERERLSVLYGILAGTLDAVVTTPAAALQYTLPPRSLQQSACHLTSGSILSPAELTDRLLQLGFARVDQVESVGQFARRGGIIDLYSQATPAPVRLEFFGDEIDRMAFFDPLSQRLTDNCPALDLLPAREVLPDAAARAQIRTAALHALKKATTDTARKELASELAAIDGTGELLFADKYIRIVHPEGSTLLHYFAAVGHPAALLLGTNELAQHLAAAERIEEERTTALLEAELLSGRYASFSGGHAAYDEFLAASVALFINPFAGNVGARHLGGLFGFRSRRTVSYCDNFPLLCDDLRGSLRGQSRLLVVCETPAGAASLVRSLAEEDIPAHCIAEQPDFPIGSARAGQVYVTAGTISSGFELPGALISVLSMLPDEAVRTARRRRDRRSTPKQKAGERLLSYADLTEGDYVVHAVYGIGRFVGMESLSIDGAMHDYITIQYAGTDKLFLPADQLELVSKYIGARSEDGEVRLSRMGGTDWQRAKSRARAAAKDMAKDLIALYAARQRRRGYAFPPDSALEEEFDDSFAYEETDSQLVAIREIKEDMERPVPMDRLLCGDVGYGKTEVAFRAAFKAIAAGKQVAILVPTTILALQHFQTALSRMRGYAVTVEMLSRFRTPKEQAAVLRRLHRGEIDLVVGTHRLLGRDVQFKDLGLLIVDEEQRFGVAQKEKLKQMATDVDVLTLTATPIPRTLNMAMTGIRDMSILDEAPGDRYPVQTFVLEHDDLILQEAMRRELARGGQVLYLYNRVESIERAAARVRRLLPDAAITVAHGKMEKEQLEDIWQALVRGEIDILVCTTIVETGVDLPNANTLIIEDADRLGLSQLHQIRGRVGRSARHAYAYFTYRQGKALSEIATKRLTAIREYAEFGAGFKIALRDLEIRGAGNLLGAEQHGHIDAVGYDLYVRLLSEAILEERGETAAAPFESVVDIRIDAHIPTSYIALSAQRMEMYKKISLITGAPDLSDVLDEFCDRFGEPPLAVQRLLHISLLRALTSRYRIERLEQRESELRFLSKEIDLAVWSELFCDNPRLRFTAATQPYVSCRLKRGEDPVFVACEIMEAYAAAAAVETPNPTEKEQA